MPYHPHMPGWLSNLNHGLLTRSDKALLEWLWWCGDRPCTDWNYQLAKRIGYSKRAVQLSLSKLYRLGLIVSEGPYGKNRELMAVKHRTYQEFLTASGQALAKSLAQKLRPPLSIRKINKHTKRYLNPTDSQGSLTKTSDPIEQGGHPPVTPRSCPVSITSGSPPNPIESQRLEIVYQITYDKLRAVGWSDKDAHSLALVKVERRGHGNRSTSRVAGT